jgi:Transcriptional regulators
MKKKRPVLQDVADKVGVTKMTVSRYLRNPDQVSAALQQKSPSRWMSWATSPTARRTSSPMPPAGRLACCCRR